MGLLGLIVGAEVIKESNKTGNTPIQKGVGTIVGLKIIDESMSKKNNIFGGKGLL